MRNFSDARIKLAQLKRPAESAARFRDSSIVSRDNGTVFRKTMAESSLIMTGFNFCNLIQARYDDCFKLAETV